MPRVLIADDHPLFREAMRLALAGLGAVDGEVLEASSIEQVIEIVGRDRELDLLLLDLKMPGMEGFAGLLELRRRFPALPVVIVSATEDPRTMREAIAAGAIAYLPKSLDRHTIAQALRQVLAGETWLPPAAGAGR